MGMVSQTMVMQLMNLLQDIHTTKNGIRHSWRLRSVDSSTSFSLLDNFGYADYYNASNTFATRIILQEVVAALTGGFEMLFPRLILLLFVTLVVRTFTERLTPLL